MVIWEKKRWGEHTYVAALYRLQLGGKRSGGRDCLLKQTRARSYRCQRHVRRLGKEEKTSKN